MVQIIAKTFGSFEAYEKMCEDSMKKYEESLSQIKGLSKFPLCSMISMLISEKFGSYDLEQIDLDPNELGEIAQDYLGEVTKFGEAFLGAYHAQNMAELEEYKKIRNAREGP
jgi:hypothetical protein